MQNNRTHAFTLPELSTVHILNKIKKNIMFFLFRILILHLFFLLLMVWHLLLWRWTGTSQQIVNADSFYCFLSNPRRWVQLFVFAPNFSFAAYTTFCFSSPHPPINFHFRIPCVTSRQIIPKSLLMCLKLDCRFLSFLHKGYKYLILFLPRSVICWRKKFQSNYPRLVAAPAGRGYYYRLGLHPARHWTRSTSGKEKKKSAHFIDYQNVRLKYIYIYTDSAKVILMINNLNSCIGVVKH
jgi:hypothetical protein